MGVARISVLSFATYARGAVFSLLIVFVAVALWHQSLLCQAQSLERAWSACLNLPSKSHCEALRKNLSQLGCKLSHENASGGAETKIVFQGSSAAAVAAVNLLLREPFAWSRWSGEKILPDTMKETITLNRL